MWYRKDADIDMTYTASLGGDIEIAICGNKL